MGNLTVHHISHVLIVNKNHDISGFITTNFIIIYVGRGIYEMLVHLICLIRNIL